jgi:hypothetical protein
MTALPDPFGKAPLRTQRRINWLYRYLRVERGFDEKLQKALFNAVIDIDDAFGDLVDDTISSQVRRVQIALAHKEIRGTIKDLFGTVGNLIRDDRQDAAVAAVDASLFDQKGILAKLFRDPLDRKQYADSLRQTARRNIEAVVTRVIESEKPLSGRVYKTRALANGQVSTVINNALARGDSARNLARDVKSLIRPDVPGGVSYATMRLGRTELNNAFHAQSIHDAQEVPWVLEAEWHLSKVHEDDPGDLCEFYAEKRIFPKEKIPEKPHPNCRCFITEVHMPYDQFENSLVQGHFNTYLDDIMESGFTG